MNTVLQPVEIIPAEPDLIDRIANALPEEIRAEYYRELRHCRSLPENDEMLRILRAMQFLVLLIEQAPSRVAKESERFDKLLTTAVDNITRMSESSEAYHVSLQKKLKALPGEVAQGISPEAFARKINDDLRQAFVRSSIPETADALGVVSGQIRNVCSDFAVAADQLGSTYRGAAEDARSAVESLKSEISQASASAARFTTELAEKFSKAHRWSLFMLAAGALVIGLVIGMVFERWLLSSQEVAAPPAAPVVQTAPPPAPVVPPAVPRARIRKKEVVPEDPPDDDR